jgi:hypothetical protein
LIGGISGIRNANRKHTKIIQAEIKIREICNRIGSSFCLNKRKNDILLRKENPAVAKIGIPIKTDSKRGILLIS